MESSLGANHQIQALQARGLVAKQIAYRALDEIAPDRASLDLLAYHQTQTSSA